MKHPRRLLAVITLLLIAVAAGTVAFIYNELERSMQSPLPITQAHLFRVAPGSNASSIARQFEALGWLSHYRLFELHARRTGAASRIQAGTYEIKPDSTLNDVLVQFVEGRTKSFKVMFVEGTHFNGMLTALAHAPRLATFDPSELKNAALARIGRPDANPEGLFFPATYAYEDGAQALDILVRAYHRMQKVLDEAWQTRAPGLPYSSPYEALTMASIVEKETGRADERAAIAGVFVRRLKLGMLLQTDPSVIYGLGATFDGNLRRADLLTDSPYNTYIRGGLPPTPIAMPGRDAIQAALHPAEGKALYFVAKGDGGHQFSNSLKDHNNAVAKFQKKR